VTRITITGVEQPELALKILKGIVKRRLTKIKEQTSELNRVIESLGKRYELSWEEFKKKFEKGELSDESDTDYVEWSAATEILQELTIEARVLEDLLK
jgi:hypothetical protein